MLEYDPYDILGTGIWQDAEKEARRRYGEQDRLTFLANARRLLREMKGLATTKKEKTIITQKSNLLKRMENKIKNIKKQQQKDIKNDSKNLSIAQINQLRREIKRNMRLPQKPKRYDSDFEDEDIDEVLSRPIVRSVVSNPRPLPIDFDDDEVSIPQGEVPQGIIDEGVPNAPPIDQELSDDDNEYDKKNSRLKRKLDFCELNKKLTKCLSGDISYLQPNINVGSVSGATPYVIPQQSNIGINRGSQTPQSIQQELRSGGEQGSLSSLAAEVAQRARERAERLGIKGGHFVNYFLENY